MRTPRRAPSGLMAGLVGWPPRGAGGGVAFRAVSPRAHPGVPRAASRPDGRGPSLYLPAAALAEAAQRAEGAWRGASEPARSPVLADFARAPTRGWRSRIRAGGGGYASLDAALGITGRG